MQKPVKPSMRMSGNSALLDTNIIIDIFNGSQEFAGRVSKFDQLYISTIVLGELYVGVNQVTNRVKHLKKVQDFIAFCTVLDVDQQTAEHFGEIMAGLRKKGKPIPTNDIWIAASAKQHSLQLVSRDKHFLEVTDLSVVGW